MLLGDSLANNALSERDVSHSVIEVFYSDLDSLRDFLIAFRWRSFVWVGHLPESKKLQV
ncbi:protein of unknown function [Ectopseudomonas oleovorans]|nr:protein of unknown function [Pseudomonas oleovorans]